MERRHAVIKWQDVSRLTDHVDLKKMVLDSLIEDPILKDVLLCDTVQSLGKVLVSPLTPDYTEHTVQISCLHGFRKIENDVDDPIYDPVDLTFSTHISHKGDIFTGVCPICGCVHVAVRPYYKGQTPIKSAQTN